MICLLYQNTTAVIIQLQKIPMSAYGQDIHAEYLYSGV